MTGKQKPQDIAESDLDQVAGGYLKIDDIAGESLRDVDMVVKPALTMDPDGIRATGIRVPRSGLRKP